MLKEEAVIHTLQHISMKADKVDKGAVQFHQALPASTYQLTPQHAPVPQLKLGFLYSVLACHRLKLNAALHQNVQAASAMLVRKKGLAVGHSLDAEAHL